MSKRNLVWLVVIVGVGVGVGIASGPIWGLVAGGTVLALSEIMERIRRRRRAQAAGTVPAKLRDALPTKRAKR